MLAKTLSLRSLSHVLLLKTADESKFIAGAPGGLWAISELFQQPPQIVQFQLRTGRVTGTAAKLV